MKLTLKNLKFAIDCGTIQPSETVGMKVKVGFMELVIKSYHNHDDYEQATELERIGGKIIVLPRSEWQELAA